jgi:hypothetical protein
MAETFSWTHSYRKALRETEDNQILDVTLSAGIALLSRSESTGLNTFGAEQLAVKTALYDRRVLHTTCRDRRNRRAADRSSLVITNATKVS